MLAASKPDEIAAIVFVDIAVIIVVARVMGALARRFRQPAVVGEIVGGIMLGPSLLGAFPGDLPARVFPVEVRPFLNVVAQLGLIIFMFIVGLELDVKLIQGKGRLAATISLSSIALPFGLGFLLAAALYSSHDVVTTGGTNQIVEFLPFALFIGASMSVTAFPVLARILTERGMFRTEVGALALACAAIDDILAWSLLAVVLAVVASSGAFDLPRILALSLVFVSLMFLVVKPRLAWLADRYRRAGRLSPDLLAVVLVGFLVSAWATSEIGIHSIFGAFLFGVIMPREGTTQLFHDILERLEPVSVLLLLPVFFVATGLDVDVTALGQDAFVQLPLILAVACAGKFLGAALAAMAQGVSARRAAAIGVLMNTRGLTELVILNVGRSFGVLDDRLFTMLVLMAIFTTVITEPILRIVYPDKQLARDIAEAERMAQGKPAGYRVVLALTAPERAAAETMLAIDLVGPERPAEVVLTRFHSAPAAHELGSGLALDLVELAASMDDLRNLSRLAEGSRVMTSVRAQFSTDPTADLLAQVQGGAADLVVIGSGAGALFDVSRLFAAGGPSVAIASGPPEDADTTVSGPVVVQPSDGVAGTLAVQLALRLAASWKQRVRIDVDAGQRGASRRASAWREQLVRAGVPCVVDSTGAGEQPSAVFVGDGTPADEVFDSLEQLAARAQARVLLVHPGDDEEEGSVERVANRLAGDPTVSVDQPAVHPTV